MHFVNAKHHASVAKQSDNRDLPFVIVTVRKKAWLNISIARHQEKFREDRYLTCFPYAMNASRVKRDGEVPGKVKRTISASGNFSFSR